MLWVDKYRPKALRQLNYHVKLSERLANLGASQNITHMLFYGPDGAGKKTRVRALRARVPYARGSLPCPGVLYRRSVAVAPSMLLGRKVK
jgi:hypothetical protein